MSEEDEVKLIDGVRRRLFFDERPKPPLFAWCEIQAAIEAEIPRDFCK